MSTDLLMPALDPNLPAELSPTIIDGVLRHDLGFDGVVITDALYMDGVTQRYSMNEAGVLAILAGCDMLEGPMTPGQMTGMINALKAALASGRLTQARIDLSVRRILVLKMRMGLIPVPLSNLAPTPAIGSMQPVDGPGLVTSIAPTVPAARNVRSLPTPNAASSTTHLRRSRRPCWRGGAGDVAISASRARSTARCARSADDISTHNARGQRAQPAQRPRLDANRQPKQRRAWIFFHRQAAHLPGEVRRGPAPRGAPDKVCRRLIRPPCASDSCAHRSASG